MKAKFSETIKSVKKNWVYLIMILPAVVLTFIFAYQPMYGIVLAFKKYDFKLGIMGSPWVKFDNFREIFAVEQFWISFKNTVIINVLKLVFGFPAPIILAIMINALKSKYIKGPIQTILYLPHFLSWIVISGLIFSLVDDGGILSLIGINGSEVFSNGHSALVVVVISDIWKEIGWGSIIYLAAISNVNQELYEAAEIDGANGLQKLRYITLPSIMPTISIMLILRVGAMVGGNFDQIYNIYNELLYKDIDVIDTFLYRYGISNGRFSQGTAIGLFINIINACLLVFANKVTKKLNGEGMY